LILISDALIALQGVEGPVERRRRAVKHGRRELDALEALKLGAFWPERWNPRRCCG
jgi:hypothetical protein